MRSTLKRGFKLTLLSIVIFCLFLNFNVNKLLEASSVLRSETIFNNKSNYSGQSSVKEQLYTAMVNRDTEIMLKCSNPKEVYNKLNDESLFKEVSNIDNPNTSDDFDYLYNNIDSYTITSNSSGVKVSLKWLEDKEQLSMVNTKIQSIFSELQIDKMNTEYEIVKALHDYIINATDYDYDYKNYASYNALFDNSTVCQGYSLLYYKLLTEAGIECRFVTGYSNDEYHGWNIVKIDDKWYNVDTTWDDLENGKITYDYFLKGSTTFNKDHTLDKEYKTKEFIQKYPIAAHDYL